MRDHALDVLLAPLVDAGEGDAEEITATVLEQLPLHERERILRDVVLLRVKRTLSARTTRSPRPEPPSHAPAPAPAIRQAPRPPESVKVAGIRDWWQSFLSEQVVLSGRTLNLGDCTAADVDVLARQRMAAAQKQARTAHGMAELAAQMREHGASTLRELPRHHAQRALTK